MKAYPRGHVTPLLRHVAQWRGDVTATQFDRELRIPRGPWSAPIGFDLSAASAAAAGAAAALDRATLGARG